MTQKAVRCSPGQRRGRALLVTPDTTGTYHCVSRCVRRAFLCGDDAFSGRNFDHRKQWLEDRLIELAEVFSISVLACAVMSNHLHVVVHVDPATSARWSDEEVEQPWTPTAFARKLGVQVFTFRSSLRCPGLHKTGNDAYRFRQRSSQAKAKIKLREQARELATKGVTEEPL